MPAMSSTHVSAVRCIAAAAVVVHFHSRSPPPPKRSHLQTCNSFLLQRGISGSSSLTCSSYSGQTIRNSIKHSWFLGGSWTKSSSHAGICGTRLSSANAPHPASRQDEPSWPQSEPHESAHRFDADGRKWWIQTGEIHIRSMFWSFAAWLCD